MHAKVLAAGLGLLIAATAPLAAQQAAPPAIGGQQAPAAQDDAAATAAAGGRHERRLDRRARRDGGRLAACQGDLAALCAGSEKGNGGRMRCLRENQARLTAGCAQSIESLRAQRKGLRQACASERETLCAKPGEGRGGLTGCLRQNADRLSESCATALAGLPGRGAMGRSRGEQAPSPTPDPAPGAPPSAVR